VLAVSVWVDAVALYCVSTTCAEGDHQA